MARYLFIVRPDDRALFDVLRERFADDENVEVILDRRRAVPPAGPPIVERRTRPEVDEEIRARGYAIVTVA